MRVQMLVALTAVLAGCGGGDETGPDELDHQPVAARLFRGDVELTPAVALGTGQAVRVTVRFYNSSGTLITGLELDHAAGLMFEPAALAAVTRVSGQPFTFDLTVASAPTAGQLRIGYGHDLTSTTDRVFGPFAVTVQ